MRIGPFCKGLGMGNEAQIGEIVGFLLEKFVYFEVQYLLVKEATFGFNSARRKGNSLCDVVSLY